MKSVTPLAIGVLSFSFTRQTLLSLVIVKFGYLKIVLYFKGSDKIKFLTGKTEGYYVAQKFYF